MEQCKARTQKGTRCKNQPLDESEYCNIHQKKDNSAIPALAIGGAILGNLIVPGVGGALFGGLIGGLLGANSKKDSDNE